MNAAEALAALEVVRHPTARGYRLKVDPRSGRVRLVVPNRARLADAMAWAREHEGWVGARLAKLPQPWPIQPGMIIPFGGVDYTLDWSPSHARGPRITENAIQIGGPIDMMPGRLLRWLRKEALTLFDAETREIGARAAVSIGRVGVGDPATRWGSCSSGGDIRYSWRLVLAPAFVRRSIVAHEVAHRVHMNHSRAFHALADSLHEGDPRAVNAWLKRHGPRLHWFGRES